MGHFELFEMAEWFEFKFENASFLKSVNKTLIIHLHTLGLPGGLLLALPCLPDPPSPIRDLFLSLHEFFGLFGGLHNGFGLRTL